jgi:hypothetical protein
MALATPGYGPDHRFAGVVKTSGDPNVTIGIARSRDPGPFDGAGRRHGGGSNASRHGRDEIELPASPFDLPYAQRARGERVQDQKRCKQGALGLQSRLSAQGICVMSTAVVGIMFEFI